MTPTYFPRFQLDRSFAVCLSILACATLPVATQAVAAKPAPNIVYILTDDLGYGDIGALNPSNKINTPQIDRLVAEGVTFTEAHSSSAVCTPSRYSILTGRYNWRTSLKSGVLSGFSKPLIENGRMTVADLLRSQGYQTAYIGKWHLGLDWAHPSGVAREAETANTNADMGENMSASEHEQPAKNAGAEIDFTKPIGRTPITLGFDQFFGISASLDMPPYVYIENDRVTALPTILSGHLEGADGHHTRNGPRVPGFNAIDVLPAFTQHAVDYIDDQAKGTSHKKPFFLFLAFPTPHTPIAPAIEWLGKSGLNYYADYVMESDDCVGKVLTALERNGFTTNTIVLFTSDNGCSPAADIPYLKSHGHDPSAGRRGYKADIYDGGHRIPFIVRWPGHVPPTSQNNGFVCLGDFMATCADLLGTNSPENAAEDSISFLPLLSNPAGPAPRDTLVESSIDGSFGIRQGQWKLAFCPGSGGWSYPRPGKDNTDGWPHFQLFDVVADPAEMTNAISQHPEIVQRLGKRMCEYIINGRSTLGRPQKNTPVKSWQQTAWMNEFNF